MASKRERGRGNTKEWMISHNEPIRIQNEGLCPTRRIYRPGFENRRSGIVNLGASVNAAGSQQIPSVQPVAQVE